MTKTKIKRLRKKLIEQDKKQQFDKAIKDARPVYDSTAALNEMRTLADKNAKYMVQLALRVIGLSSATNYANAMLDQDIADDGVSIPAQEVLNLATKLMRIKMTRLIARHMKISKTDLQLIISNLIQKDFSPRMGVAATPALAAPDLRKLLNGTRYPDNSPPFGRIQGPQNKKIKPLSPFRQGARKGQTIRHRNLG